LIPGQSAFVHSRALLALRSSPSQSLLPPEVFEPKHGHPTKDRSRIGFDPGLAIDQQSLSLRKVGSAVRQAPSALTASAHCQGARGNGGFLADSTASRNTGSAWARSASASSMRPRDGSMSPGAVLSMSPPPWTAPSSLCCTLARRSTRRANCLVTAAAAYGEDGFTTSPADP